MTTPNKIIIGLLTLMVVIIVAWFVMDYQKTERQYRACMSGCWVNPPNFPGLPELPGAPSPSELKSCEYDCEEKYGK